MTKRNKTLVEKFINKSKKNKKDFCKEYTILNFQEFILWIFDKKQLIKLGLDTLVYDNPYNMTIAQLAELFASEEMYVQFDAFEPKD